MSLQLAITCTPIDRFTTITLLGINALAILVFISIGFAIARLRNRIDTVDVCWGLGFIVTAVLMAVLQPSDRTLVIAVLVSLWGGRLALHLGRRVRSKPEDPRYQAMRDKWSSHVWLRAYGSIFLVQALGMWLIGLPIVLAIGRQLDGFDWLTIVGATIWAAGFLVESTADRQLSQYLAENKRPKVMDRGLWRYSRHPNYFGELTQWWGIGIIACQASYGYIGLIGPLVLTILICFVSGIPSVEKRRAKDPAYRKYQQRTSPLIPLPRQASK